MRDFDPTASEFISSGYLETSRPGGRAHDVFSAVAGIGSALIGADASDDAASAQSQAAADTNATNRYIFDKQVELQQPFRDAGLTSSNRLMQLMGLSEGGADNGFLMDRFDASQMYDDPGYQFRLDEGMKGLENSAAARGGLLSGAAMKAISKYGQDYASNEYQNSYNRFNADQTNQYNRLAGIVNTGMGATNQISNAAGQYANNTANANSAMGNAQAAGAIGTANAITGGIASGVNAYSQNQLMKMIQSPNGGYTPAFGQFYDY